MFDGQVSNAKSDSKSRPRERRFAGTRRRLVISRWDHRRGGLFLPRANCWLTTTSLGHRPSAARSLSLHSLPLRGFWLELSSALGIESAENCIAKIAAMKTSEIYRENAENCLQLSERATSEPAAKRYRRMAKAWIALADEQDWLDGEISFAASAALSRETRPQ